jgi:hypothetical protein
VIPLPGSATLYRIGAVVALLVGVWAHGYHRGQQGPLRELAAVQAVATAQDARYRNLEMASAQQKHVEAWRDARQSADAAWVRLKSASSSRVPAVCPESGGVNADPGNGVEAAGGASHRNLLETLVGALATGEELESRLGLCQQELRQCAGMR